MPNFHLFLPLPVKFSFLLFSAGPSHSSKVFDNDTLPELPSVPDTFPTNSIGGNTTSDDIDFDDLTRRFEELKKKT